MEGKGAFTTVRESRVCSSHCTPLFAYLRGHGVNHQGEIELDQTDILSVKVPQNVPPRKSKNAQWKGMAEQAVREIRERRKPIKHAIAAKRTALHHLDQYSHALDAVYHKGSSPGLYEPVFKRDEFVGIQEIQGDTERESKVEKGEFDQALEIFNHPNKRRGGALQSFKKFDGASCWFHPHHWQWVASSITGR